MAVAVSVDAGVSTRSSASAAARAAGLALAVPANRLNANRDPYQPTGVAHVHPSHHPLVRHVRRLPARAALTLAAATGRCDAPRAHERKRAMLPALITHVLHYRDAVAVAIASNSARWSWLWPGCRPALQPCSRAARIRHAALPRTIHINTAIGVAGAMIARAIPRSHSRPAREPSGTVGSTPTIASSDAS